MDYRLNTKEGSVKTLYLIGAPGSGKTTLMAELMKDWILLSRDTKPVKHSWYESPYGIALELGHPRAPFGGTDTLSYTAIKTLELWLPHLLKVDLLVGEGDRLANNRFLDLCKTLGPTHLYYLDATEELLQERRGSRATQHDLPTQSPQWAKGRLTKHRNLAQQQHATTLNSNENVSSLALTIHTHLNAHT